MTTSLMKLSVWAQIWRDDNGQDLIEYALICALLAFGAALGLGSVAQQINTAFSQIGHRLVTCTAG